MLSSMISRRALIALLPVIAEAAQKAQATGKLAFFTSQQARDVEAIAAQLIPSDDTPGAKEAGVLYFIDRALSQYFPEKQPVYTKGLAELSGFARLTREQQIAKLRSIEKTEFFEAIRTHTVMAFFADPRYGGNPDRIGWKLIGFPGAHNYRPPFGAYDAEI